MNAVSIDRRVKSCVSEPRSRIFCHVDDESLRRLTEHLDSFPEAEKIRSAALLVINGTRKLLGTLFIFSPRFSPTGRRADASQPFQRRGRLTKGIAGFIISERPTRRETGTPAVNASREHRQRNDAVRRDVRQSVVRSAPRRVAKRPPPAENPPVGQTHVIATPRIDADADRALCRSADIRQTAPRGPKFYRPRGTVCFYKNFSTIT